MCRLVILVTLTNKSNILFDFKSIKKINPTINQLTNH